MKLMIITVPLKNDKNRFNLSSSGMIKFHSRQKTIFNENCSPRDKQ